MPMTTELLFIKPQPVLILATLGTLAGNRQAEAQLACEVLAQRIAAGSIMTPYCLLNTQLSRTCLAFVQGNFKYRA